MVEVYYLLDLERTLLMNAPHFWKKNKFGYTNNIKEAGLYPFDEAQYIVNDDVEHRTIMIKDSVIQDIFK